MVLRLKAVEYQAQLCAWAFGKNERAHARGEDIAHKEHQKRLKVGRPIQAVSVATWQSQQDRLVQDFQAEQLQEIATGVLNPHPVPAAATEQAPNPLCEPSGVLQPAKRREEPTPAARELRFDGYTAEARLHQPIGIDRMRSCAEATGGRYTPQSNASIIVYEKGGDLEATVTANTGVLLMCMGAPSPEAARCAIGTVAGRIGPVREGSYKITNITGGAHLGVDVDPSTLAVHLDVNFEGEFETCVKYRHGEVTVRIYESGSVRVTGHDERAAMAAYLHVRKVVFTLRNDAMPEMPQYTWFVPASDDLVPADGFQYGRGAWVISQLARPLVVDAVLLQRLIGLIAQRLRVDRLLRLRTKQLIDESANRSGSSGVHDVLDYAISMQVQVRLVLRGNARHGTRART